jgi:hypothetical protein
MAANWDFFVPRSNVESILIATEEHDLKMFGDAAGQAAQNAASPQPAMLHSGEQLAVAAVRPAGRGRRPRPEALVNIKSIMLNARQLVAVEIERSKGDLLTLNFAARQVILKLIDMVELVRGKGNEALFPVLHFD